MIRHITQPTWNTCGQTCLAMLACVPVESVVSDIGRRGTHGSDLIRWLRAHGFVTDARPRRFPDYDPKVDPRPRLPPITLVRVDHGRHRQSTHWLLWAEGRFWDPAAKTADERESLLSLGNGRIYSLIAVG